MTSVERVGSFSLPEESSTWLAYYHGNGGAGGGGGRGGRGGRAGGGGAAAAAAAAPPAAARRPAARRRRPAAAHGAGHGRRPAREAQGTRRKGSGGDLIVRNLATGEEITIPEVTEYEWNNGDWIAYASRRPTRRRTAPSRATSSDGAVKRCHAGKGHYKASRSTKTGTQLAFLSDQADYDKEVSPYRLYYWKAGDAAATELVVRRRRAACRRAWSSAISSRRASRRTARGCYLGTAPPPAPPADPKARRRRCGVDLWNYKDPQMQPMQQVRASRSASATTAPSSISPTSGSSSWRPRPAERQPGRRSDARDRHVRPAVSPGNVLGQTYNDVFLVDLKTGAAAARCSSTGSGAATMSPGGKYVLYFDETRQLVHLSRRRRRAHQPHREDRP